MRRLLVALTAALLVLAPGTPAWAHARLVSSDPAEGSTLTAAPATVTLEFSERLNPDFTTVVLSDAAMRRVPAADVTVENARGTLTPTGELANGIHTVAYRVVSVDGHTVQGSYTFTLADPELPAAVAPQQSAAAAPDTSPAVSGGVLIGVAAAGVLLFVGAAGLLIFGRRRRSTAGA
ncbi:copper resistance CopC family protein [Actinoplanes sp. DH11]|uniref:copper resistance CopC family protein n=1 Tax=Actinoplanes sp. DH11 TaxID=2857011 RepID=UPI001E3F71B8|nr:copper resistance CopC family protein [Actinoplanes sp. DH11]